MTTTVSVFGGHAGVHDPILGDKDLPFTLPVPNTLIVLGPAQNPAHVHLGNESVGFVGAFASPEGVRVRAGGTDGNADVDETISAPFIVLDPDSGHGHVGVAGVGFAGAFVDPQGAQVRAGGADGQTVVDESVKPPFTVVDPQGGHVHVGIKGVGFAQAFVTGDNVQVRAGDGEGQESVNVFIPPNEMSSSSSNDTISFGSGSDTVVQAGSAAVSGLGQSLALDSIAPVGASSSSAADPFADTINLGADSLAAVQLVSDFASSADLAQPISSATDDLAGAAGGSLVSMDGGLTTIELKNITDSSFLKSGN